MMLRRLHQRSLRIRRLALPLVSNLAINSALQFDARTSQQRAGAELRMMVVEQVLTDHRNLEVLSRLPGQASVQGNARIHDGIEPPEPVHETADQVKLQVARRVPGRLQVDLLLRTLAFRDLCRRRHARATMELHLQKRIRAIESPPVCDLPVGSQFYSISFA